MDYKAVSDLMKFNFEQFCYTLYKKVSRNTDFNKYFEKNNSNMDVNSETLLDKRAVSHGE